MKKYVLIAAATFAALTIGVGAIAAVGGVGTIGAVARAIGELFGFGEKIFGIFDFGGDDEEELRRIITEYDIGEGMTLDRLLAAQLDCSVVDKELREQGLCLDGYLPYGEEYQSPIPPGAIWLVPIWEAAGKKYGVPWQLLAAVNATRTDFGRVNCSSNSGDGFYRIPKPIWQKARADGGNAKMTSPPAGASCPVASEPVNLKKPDGKTDIYDPVDAAFTVAAWLRSRIDKSVSTWEYGGEAAGVCRTGTRDGKVFFYAETMLGGGAGSGDLSNPNTMTAEAIDAFLRSRNSPMAGHGKDFIAAAKRYRVDPRLVLAISAAETTWGTNGNGPKVNNAWGFLDSNSNHIPYPSWSVAIDKVTSWLRERYLNRGLDTIVEIRDTYAPLSAANDPLGLNSEWVKNVVAGWQQLNTVALVKTEPPVRPSSTPADQPADTSTETGSDDATKAPPYKGKVATDAVSLAVKASGVDGKPFSDCYVAAVHDWYEAIMAAPPPLVGLPSGALGRMIQIALGELAKGVAEQPLGSNSSPEIDAYLTFTGISTSLPAEAKPWCAAFVSWVAYKAGVKFDYSAGVYFISQWAARNNVLKLKGSGYVPRPGDLALFESDGGPYPNDHIGIVVGVYDGGKRVKTIEGNTGEGVVATREYDVATTSRLAGYAALTLIYSLPDADDGSDETPSETRTRDARTSARSRVRRARRRTRVSDRLEWQAHRR